MAKRWVADPLVHQMAESYARQRLVPFLGAGMSVPRCVTWEAFVGALEERAGLATDASRADLAERANRALASLRRREVADLRDALREALLPDSSDSTIPRQTEALARLDWPVRPENPFATSDRPRDTSRRRGGHRRWRAGVRREGS